MSPAKLLSHLRTGDLIIVPGGGNAPARPRPLAFLPSRVDAENGNEGNPRKLLRSLIARRRRGEKK